jgi:hypothetical protein
VKQPQCPPNLGRGGRKLWRDAVSQYAFRVDELTLLERACRQLDLVVAAETECADAPMRVKGSRNQPVVNPVFREARERVARYQSLIKQLRIPDPAEVAPDISDAVPSAGSAKARKAVRQRWDNRFGPHGA